MATLQLSSGLTMACASVFIPVSTIVMGLRLWTRRVQKLPLGIDDWIMIPAWVFLMGMQITMIIETRRKMIGYPDPNFKPGVLDARTNLAFWPFELLQIPALGLVKLSVVFFYKRVFSIYRRTWQFWTTFVTLCIISAWTVAYFFSFLFICRGNPSNYWKSAKAEKTYCVKTQELHLSFAISDTILDIIVMAIVVPMIWRLHLSTSRKFAVTGIFGLGLITVAASLTRMAVFVQATALRYDPNLDFEYLDTSAMYWSMLETGLGFITANLIIVYSLVAHYHLIPRLRSLRSSVFTLLLSPAQSRNDEEKTITNTNVYPSSPSSFKNHFTRSREYSTYTTETHGGSTTTTVNGDTTNTNTVGHHNNTGAGELHSDDENIYVRKEFGTRLTSRAEEP